VILYWDRSIITDETTDFNRPDIVLTDRENKTALLTDTAVPLTQNLPKTEAEEITKNENLALEIRETGELNNLSIEPLVITEEEVAKRTFIKYLQNIGLTRNILRVGKNN
jgi:hypothetical protein